MIGLEIYVVVRARICDHMSKEIVCQYVINLPPVACCPALVCPTLAHLLLKHRVGDPKMDNMQPGCEHDTSFIPGAEAPSTYHFSRILWRLLSHNRVCINTNNNFLNIASGVCNCLLQTCQSTLKFSVRPVSVWKMARQYTEVRARDFNSQLCNSAVLPVKLWIRAVCAPFTMQ